MFQVTSFTTYDQQFVHLENDDGSAFAKVSLKEGGRLSELQFQDLKIISDAEGFDYKNSYASAILFPFVGRMDNGKYSFNNKEHQLDKNDQYVHALHGLLYYKSFSVVDSFNDNDSSSVTISFEQYHRNSGFPFLFQTWVTYTLGEDSLEVEITIKNRDGEEFPFSVGWHPYFNTSDLKHTRLRFGAHQKLNFNDEMIAQELIGYQSPEYFEVNDEPLDDCFVLKGNRVELDTPNYSINIKASSAENYLQLYTPPGRSMIAVEPMTGTPNNFNNKIGLKTLEAGASNTVTWSLTFNKKIQ
ncbi:MAG: aldose 1-epimerase [Nonlabens sp.]